jgi:hypothetical protein
MKSNITPREHRAEQVATLEAQMSAMAELSLKDKLWALGRISKLQGPSPHDRNRPQELELGTWVTLWELSGHFRPAAVQQVYEELVAEGKIKP